MIKDLTVYQIFDDDMYRGISRRYFPKWEGWDMLDKGVNKKEVDKAVERFYMRYYYDAMALHLLKNAVLVYLLLNFASLHGKRKAIMKLQIVLNHKITGMVDDKLYKEALEDPCVVSKLLLEFNEFYYFIDDTKMGSWVIDYYRQLRRT